MNVMHFTLDTFSNDKKVFFAYNDNTSDFLQFHLFHYCHIFHSQNSAQAAMFHWKICMLDEQRILELIKKSHKEVNEIHLRVI